MRLCMWLSLALCAALSLSLVAGSSSLFDPSRARSVVAAAPAPAPIDLAGHFWYHDRDNQLLPLPATLTCMSACDSSTPSYRATLQFTSILLGNLVLNSRLVGFGQGPAPKVIGGCSDDHFTVILEDDDFASGNIFAAYAPCNSYVGGASIYSKDKSASLLWSGGSASASAAPSHPHPLLLPGNTTGKYIMTDRNNVLSPQSVLLWCVDDCDGSAGSTPAVRGTFGGESDEFLVTFAPDGFVGFGTITVDDATTGNPCGRTTFTVLVPPTGMAKGAPLLGAAAPLPECGYAGAAYRFTNA